MKYTKLQLLAFSLYILGAVSVVFVKRMWLWNMLPLVLLTLAYFVSHFIKGPKDK